MADTDTELQNGIGAVSEEDERLKQRPADIDADVREMERRKRVEALMSSKLFREELERVLDQQLHEGSDAPLLQRIREMVGGRLHTGSLRGPSCVLPINDIRGIEGVGYEKGEKILRCKLAAVYRLVDLFGWTQTGITGQITARLNTAVEQVLTTPRGLLPHEVTASSLVKVDMQGTVQDQGTTNFPVNVEGFSLHATVHASRPDVRCVLHVRSPSALAVSSMKRGLLPLCHEAALLGDIAYHHVPYGTLDNEERDKLVRALGPHAKVLMLASGGALCCGATLEEAFFQARHLTAACDVQLRVSTLPVDELQLIDDETRKLMFEAAHRPPAESGSKWRVGGEEFEALMRMLDNAGFRTGYIYRHPLIKNDVPKPKNDVEVPPAVSSLGYLLEEEELYRQGLWKKGTGTRGERTRWLNSPNVYQKVEMLETGTTDPKKITKWVDANNDEWVQDGSPAHSSTPVKIDTLQFVPMKTNPKEFKKLQQQIKENRRADKISAGPQSHILEGVTWDEANKLVGEDAHNTHTGDHVVLMGAASKGIIQRGYQHNATMYSAPYARNPFDHVTDREIDEYRRVVERKQRSDYDTDLSESEAISAAQITSPASATETEEESRDEHRVLRIETKQVPVRSQPEVVLSDDFLNAERAHADRFKDRDPNLLSDDEVFLDSASSVTSPMTSPLPARAPVVVHQRVVQRSIVRGTEKRNTATNTIHEAMSSNKRSLHGYPRANGLENIIKKFDSPEQSEREDFKRPKCKVNLNSQLESVKCDSLDIYNRGNASSRSSLYSIPSLDWDGRCKSEYVFKTQSLPRQKSKPIANKLHRTQSHSGFVNAHIKDPEPFHYHLPRCRSCGAFNSSYAWELSRKEREEKRKRMPYSMYFSVDDLPRKCLEEREANVVKVAEKVVPMFKVEKGNEEFVESQEFNEDNYFGEIGNSFSSENQTVVENDNGNDKKNNTVTEETIKADGVENADLKSQNNVAIGPKDAIYKAELIPIISFCKDEGKSNTIDVVEGEYHNFTEDVDFDDSLYESPVKDLVEKDIRDYSVPIDFYYDGTKGSPEKKRRELVDVVKANLLEPILEESKSSYGDDSRNSSGNHGKASGNETEFTIINSESKNMVNEINQKEKQAKHNMQKDIEDKAIKELFVKADNSKKRVEDIKMVTEEGKAVKESLETVDVEADNSNVQKDTEDKCITGLILDTLNIKADNCKLQTEDIQRDTKEDEAITELLKVVDLKADDSNTFILESGVLKEKIIDCKIELQQKEELKKSVETNTQSCLGLESGTTDITFLQNIMDEILIKTSTAYQLKFEINFPDSKKVTTELLEFECRSKQESYVLVDEDTEFTTNDIGSIATNLEQTAVDIYSEAEVEETYVEQDQIIESILDDVLKILSTDAVIFDIVQPVTAEMKDERRSLYSVASSVPEQPSFDTTAEFEKYETIADIVTKILDKIDFDSSNQEFFNIQRKVLKEYLFDVDADVSKAEIAHEHRIYENKTPSNEMSSKSESTCMDLEDKYANPENCINFSITTMIKDLENNLNLNETVLTEHSDTESSLEHKIVESVLYYILDRAFFLYSNKNKCKRIKRPKKVITVVGEEDILYTAVPLWSESDRAFKDLSIEDEIPLDKELTFDDIETCLSNHSNAEESELPNHDSRLKSLEFDFDRVHCDDETVTIDVRESNVIHDSYQPAQTENVNVTNMPLDLSKCKSEQFEVDLTGNYTKDNESHCEIYQDLEFDVNKVLIKRVDLETNENGYTEFCFGHHTVVDKKSCEENFTCDNSCEDNNKAHEVLKSNAPKNISVESLSTSYEMAADIVCEMLERSTLTFDSSHVINDTEIETKRGAKIENNFIKTFVLGQGDMNTAFVISESLNDYSRSSSPHKEAIFDACTESPIKNPNDTFIGDDLSVLYEKDDTILGSPFIKKVPVLSMSQTVHSGGIKYWVSFDESLTMDSDSEKQVSKAKPKKNLENKIPSFLVVDLSETENETETTDDSWSVFEKGMYRRSSILMENFNNSEELTRADETYVTSSVSDYKTCESDFIDNVNEDEPQKRLLFDSRVDLKRTKRKYSSWPPFDDTLFYRIISKFRMSESFDPSDLENMTVNSSTSF